MRPSWAALVNSLLTLSDQTLPGVYLDLTLPVIPTPPSSPGSSSSLFWNTSLSTTTTPLAHHHLTHPPGYMLGISPLAQASTLSPHFLPPPYSPLSVQPSAPPYVLVRMSRRMSKESGYNSNTGGGLVKRYYNLRRVEKSFSAKNL